MSLFRDREGTQQYSLPAVQMLSIVLVKRLFSGMREGNKSSISTLAVYDVNSAVVTDRQNGSRQWPIRYGNHVESLQRD